MNLLDRANSLARCMRNWPLRWPSWLVLLACLGLNAHGAPTPFDYWNFDNAASREAALVGSGALGKNGTIAYVQGPNGATDGAAQISANKGSYYRVTHGMAANGGGSQVNAYTLLWDVKYANNSTWKCLLQTASDDSNDGDLFINTSGQVGSSAAMGGYGGSTTAGNWYRIVLVVNSSSGLGNNDVRLYVNGVQVLTKWDISTDSRLCLYAAPSGQFLVSEDDDGEDDTLVLSTFACWNTDLSDADVVGLGGPGNVILKNNQTINFAPLPGRTNGDPAFTLGATASSGLPVSFSLVSGPATVSGTQVTITGPGVVTIRASQAGDANYNAAPAVDQSFTVAVGNLPPVISGVDFSATNLLRNGKLRLDIHASDPNPGDTLGYACDFEGSGTLTNLAGPMAEHIYTNSMTCSLRVRVQDNHGLMAGDYTGQVQVGQAQSGTAGTFGPALFSLVSPAGLFDNLISFHPSSSLSAAILKGTNVDIAELPVSMAWRDRASSENGLLYSPAVRMDGFSDTGSNTYVIQMSYDPALAGTNPVCLSRFDGSAWVKAVDDNTSGTANNLGANHPFNPATDFALGNYGADSASRKVWAVVNQSGDFAAARLYFGPQWNLMVVSAQGSPVPAAGAHSYTEGAQITCQVPNSMVVTGLTQYVCQGWQMTGNTPYSGSGTSFTFSPTNNATLTWQWSTNFWLDLETAGGGALSRPSGWYAAGSTVVVDAQSSWTTGVFQNWTGDTNGCLISNTRISIPMDRPRGPITAQFLKPSFQFTVVSPHGTCAPAVGTYSYPGGSSLTNSAMTETLSSTQYVCAGWTMSGDAPHTGSASSFTMTHIRDSILTWNWTTNFWLATASGTGGTVSVANGWQAAGSSVMLAAQPAGGYVFSYWSGDTNGCLVGGDHLVVPMSRPRAAITANFIPDADFTVVALPDTQNYSSAGTTIWTSQTGWIVNNISALNIQYVTHLGDIVNTYSSSSEWANSVVGMDLLNGKVPYGLAVGNHDIDGGQSDTHFLNNYGPNSSRWKTGGAYYPWYGGTSPSGLSSYRKLTIAGRTYLFLHLDIDCPTPELNWAQSIINANRNVLTFMTVHNWLAETGASGDTGTGNGARGRCYETYTSAPQGNSPNAVWSSFVQPNNEIFAIICGHNFAQYNLVDYNNAGKPVQEIIVDYQTLPNGGNGFLRIMKFRPSLGIIENTTYSPYLGRNMTVPANSDDSQGMLDLTDPYGSAFTLNIDFNHRFDGVLSVKYAGGPGDGATRTNGYAPGTAVAMNAPDVRSGQTLYTCSGWTLTGSQSGSGSGSSASLIMNGNATLTWNWNTKYWLETAETGNGQVSVYSGWQLAGSQVTLTAAPAPGASFLRWSGDIQGCTANGATLTVPMDRPRSPVTAEFSSPIPNYMLTVVSDQGSVTPAPGVYSYSPGSTAHCTAQDVVAGSTRQSCLGWSASDGDSGAANSVDLIMNNDMTLTWFWETEYQLQTQVQGPGSVDVPSGWYAASQAVTMHAVPSANAHFVGWSGDLTGCAVQGSALSAPMNRPYGPIQARFQADQVTLQIVSAHGSGSPAAGTYTFGYGTVVSNSMLNEVIGRMQYACSGWTLQGQQPAAGSSNVAVFCLTNNATLTWLWQTQVLLTVASDGHGVITPMAAAGWYDLGSTVTLHAQPDALSRFAQWSGDVAGDPACQSLVLTMDGAKSVSAGFAPGQAAGGTPWWWLARHHLVVNGNYNEAEASDTDGDGATAGQEFLAGTDPNDPESVLKIISLQQSPAPGSLTWNSVAGWNYSVEVSTDLNQGFVPFKTLAGAAGQTTVPLPDVSPSLTAWFRVRAYPPVEAWSEPARPCVAAHPFSLIPAGDFIMGDSEFGGGIEYPQHPVTLTSPYQMDIYDVTISDWVAVCAWAATNGYDLNPTPLFEMPTNHPIQAVSWYDAVKWCNARSEMEGRVPSYYSDQAGQNVYRAGELDLVSANVNWAGNGYRLPTEAEWERAARGGLPHANFPWGDTADASQFNVWQYWVEVLDIQSPFFPWTTPVGYFNGRQTPPGPDMTNGFGLYDMAGNVWQWCWDRASDYSPLQQFNPAGPDAGDQRINRGGSWWNNVDDARVAKRYPYTPAGDDVYGSIGFRCVCTGSACSAGAPPATAMASSDTMRMDVVVKPQIVSGPVNSGFNAGQTIELSVIASGAGPLTYQWQLNGVNLADNDRISGSAGPVLRITGATAADAGTYRVIVTNAGGSASSSGALLTFQQAPPPGGGPGEDVPLLTPGQTVALGLLVASAGVWGLKRRKQGASKA